MLLLERLAALCSALGLLALCLTLGAVVLDRLPSGLLRRPVAAVGFALVTGMAAYAGGILTIGLTGWLEPWGLALVTGAAVGGAARGVTLTRGLLRRCADAVEGRWDLLAFAVLGVLAFAMLIQASSPPTDWDSLAYHLEVPAAWLERGRIFLPPDNLHAAFTGLLHLLYVPLLAVGAESGPALLSALLACVLALLLYELGDRFFDRTTGRIAMLALFGSPMVIFVATTPRVDVTTTLFLIVGFYGLMAALFGGEGNGPGTPEAETDCSHLVDLSAIVLGLATGVKLLALPALAAMVPLAIWALMKQSTGGREAAMAALRALALFTLAAAPWILHRWVLVGAPFYPYLAPRHLEPWLQGLYGAEWLPADVARYVDLAPAYVREPVSLGALLFRPGSLTPEREGALYFPSLLLGLLPLALLLLRDRRLWTVLGVAVLFASLVLLWNPRTNLRYLLPAIPLLTLGSARLLSWGAGRLRSAGVTRALIGGVLVLSVAPASFPFLLHWREAPVLRYAIGLVDTRKFYREHQSPDVNLWFSTAAWLNDRLSPADTLLMFFELRGYPLEVAKLQDNLLNNWTLLAQAPRDQACGYLEEIGVTHVLVNYGVMGVHLSHGMPPEAVSWSSFQTFARDCLVREAAHSPYVLYRIQAGARPRSRGASHSDTTPTSPPDP